MLYSFNGSDIKYVSKLDDSDSKQQQEGKVSYVSAWLTIKKQYCVARNWTQESLVVVEKDNWKGTLDYINKD